MSVKDNVAFGLRMRHVPEQEITERVRHILDIVKISHLKNRMPLALSGGQQQRVALARAIVIRPEVLLMDEPLSNLDAKLRIEMRNAIKQIQRKVDITTVYVTHDQEEALAVSDRIAVMNGGVIQQIGTPQEIYTRPFNVFVSTFIGLSNLLRARVISREKRELAIEGTGYHCRVPQLSSSVWDGQEVIVSARPEEFHIAPPGEGIPAVVESSVFLGLSTHYFVKTKTGQALEILSTGQDQRPGDGTEIGLRLAGERINVFHKDTKETLMAGEGE